MIGYQCNIDTFDDSSVVTVGLGEFIIECCYCQALGFISENKGTTSRPHFGKLCCNQDKVQLELWTLLPQELVDLVTGYGEVEKYFQINIRKFN